MTEESGQCLEQSMSYKEEETVYYTSIDETDKLIPNRLDDFYINETKCEFEGCSLSAVHHCCGAW